MVGIAAMLSQRQRRQNVDDEPHGTRHIVIHKMLKYDIYSRYNVTRCAMTQAAHTQQPASNREANIVIQSEKR